MNGRKIAFLLYDETGTNTLVTDIRPVDISVDLAENTWWQNCHWEKTDSSEENRNSEQPNWRGKTPLGKHRLFFVRHKPGKVIGVYDCSNPLHLEQMNKDAREAVLP